MTNIVARMRNLLSFSSNAGGIDMSLSKLKTIQPNLFSDKADTKLRTGWIKLLADQLKNGDARAAVVIDPEQGLVAAYSDEIDCVVTLKFDLELAQSHGWKAGTRLLTVNTYQPIQKGLAADLVPGPKHTRKFGNVRPIIADLLTDDAGSVDLRKQAITEPEWSRALQLGNEAMVAKKFPPRDGRPLRCDKPAN